MRWIKDDRGDAYLLRLLPHAALVGRISDLDLVRRTGISRVTIVTIRQVLGIPATPPTTWSPAQVREWGGQLASWRFTESGCPWAPCAADARAPLCLLNRLDPELDDTSSAAQNHGGSSDACGNYHRHIAGGALRAIAERAGCTSERIRQIVKCAGLPARAVALRKQASRKRTLRARILAKRRIAREQQKRRTARKQQAHLRKFLRPAQRQWLRGDLLREIATHYTISMNSMAWWI